MASVHPILCFFLLLSAAASAAKIATHIHFYLHDTITGPNPSAVRVVTGPNCTTGFTFGDVFVMDDPMTEGPDVASRLVGRAQGFYATTSKGTATCDDVLLLTVNLVFVGGTYNGSTLAVLSRDPIGDEVRELPVVGGTGAFRMVRGYVMMKTYSIGTSGEKIFAATDAARYLNLASENLDAGV